ncbi:MAG: DUF882 domain-containing protein [bacterium]
MLQKILISALFLFGLATPCLAGNAPRFWISGDGTLVLAGQSILFRNPDGSYDEGGLKRINRIFQADWPDPSERLSLRFIEVLDAVQDQLQGGSYSLKSGYRSPKLNNSLRDQGKLAAQSSMHIEAAAGDLILGGVDSARVFDYVKSLDCCGIGYYHGRHFHIDTGPARYWDETTSKTEDKTPQENEKIILQSDYDLYRPGETLTLKFMRVTNYPIGVDPKLEVLGRDGQDTGKSLRLESPEACLLVQDRAQARTLKAKLPDQGLKPGQYVLQVKFCNRFDYAKMPESILSRPFEIRKDLP